MTLSRSPFRRAPIAASITGRRPTSRRRSRFVRQRLAVAITGGAIFTVVAAGLAAVPFYETGTHETHTCTVESKDRVVTQNGTDARVYTDCGIFQVADSLWNLEFASADTYASLHEGDTYRLTTYGWRVPFLSLFPVIIDAEPVTHG